MNKLPRLLDSLSPQQRRLLIQRMQQEARERREAEEIRGPAAVPAGRIVPRRQGSAAPLSLSQQRLWFLDQLDPGNVVYNLATAVELEGHLAVPALRAAIGEVVRRHESLRTTLAVAAPDGEPAQVVHPRLDIGLPVLDLRALPAVRRREEVERQIDRVAQQPYDLVRGPLLRLILVPMGAERHVLALAVHHIVSDAWSSGIFVRDLTALYRAFVQGLPSPLPPLPIQYADFAVWQRHRLQGELLERELAYWQSRLSGAPQLLELPTDRPRQPSRGLQGQRVPVLLSDGLTLELRAFGRRQEMTLPIVAMAAFQIVLSRYSGQKDLVVGTPIAGRNRLEIEDLIGFFVNLLALRTDLSGNPTLGQFLAIVREEMYSAYAHQELPFERLVDHLQPERSLSHTPLFQVVFNFITSVTAESSLPGLVLRPLELDPTTAMFDLVLVLEDTVTSLRGSIVYDASLYDRSTVCRMAGHFQTLLAGFVADPERRLSAIPLLAEGEKAQLVSEWNDTAVERLQVPLVHELFALQAELRPDATAVISGAGCMTYRQLDLGANQLAHHLRTLGVQPGELVGVLLDRSAGMIVAPLGVLKSGAAYVPLETRYPEARLHGILEAMQVRVALVDSAHLPLLAGLLPTLPALRHLVCLDRSAGSELPPGRRLWGPADLEAQPDRCPLAVNDPDDLAYVIFTSGSTGRPKGVMERHRPVVNLIDWVNRTFDVSSSDRLLFVSSFGFDLSVYDVFGTLAAGGTVRVVSQPELEDAEALAGILVTEGITFWDSAPAALQQLVPLLPPAGQNGLGGALRLVFLSGDWIPVALPDQVRAAFPRARVIALGGATEATIWSNFYPVGIVEAGWRSIPYGRPLQNARYYVLDEWLNPCPIGVAGDLYIGGGCLSSGYAGAPALTANQYLPDPFAGARGGVMYRTGDRARFLTDGNLEFLGRLDQQVKIRGFRIELGEVEVVLALHPAVDRALALVREDRPGDRRLTAYVVPKTAPWPSAEELRAYVREHLPDYMVPAAFVLLAALPLTANGKVDRKALPAPERGQGGESRVAPRTPTEELIAEIWCQVLGVEQAGAEDDFFELGGHSLLATQVMSRLQQTLGVAVPLRQLFQGPTVAELARAVEAAKTAGRPIPPIVPVARDRDLPLSFAQERMWFLHQLDPSSPAYHIPLALRMRGELRFEVLAAAIQGVVRRHEVLRTVFRSVDGMRVQVVLPGMTGVTTPRIDLAGLSAAAQEREARRLMLGEMIRPFDLSTGPLLRTCLLRLGGQEHLLLVNMHHIVSDGWSMGIWVREVSALYEAGRRGEPSPLAELTGQYADFAVWQRSWLQSGELERQLAYWRRQLAGGPAVLELPADRPRPAVKTFLGARQALGFSAAVSAAVRELARREGVTLFMTVLAAYAALLGRYGDQREVAVGSPIANRNHMEIEGLIGCFVNTLVLRLDLSGEPSFRDLLERARQVALAAYDHQDLPFEQIVEELQPERNMSRTPLFQAVLALQNAPVQNTELAALRISPFEFENRTAKFDLTLELAESEAGLVGGLEYSTDLFEAPTIVRLARHLENLLAAAAERCEQRIAEIPLLSWSEQHQILREWNAEEREYCRQVSLPELFGLRAEARPDSVAVVSGSHHLSWQEVQRRADGLARLLESRALGPGDLIGVVLDRSAAMVPALLGILSAGAAYVPLEPRLPEARIRGILEAMDVPAVVTQTSHLPLLAGRLPALREILCVDDPRLERVPASAFRSRASADDLAYVIFTSGSTGTPKGVMVRHRPVVNLIEWVNRTFAVGPADRVLLVASLGFDLSVYDVFGLLAAGGSIRVATEEEVADPRELARILGREPITFWDSAPAALQQLVPLLPESVQGGGGEGLRLVFLSGDWIPLPLPAQVKASFPRARVIALGGATEATVWSNFHPVGEVEAHWRSIPYGRPIQNARYYVLDAALRPCPVGAPGDLHIGGECLSSGYARAPELTAQKYLPDPWGGEPGAVMYRTGDRARFFADGKIEFLGRLDHQVKIRGFRIELGEIESALSRHAGVREALAVVREDRPGDRRLVAYAIAAEGSRPTAEELRSFVQQRLPEYMVPSAFLFLDAFPVTANGKLDRKALPALEPGPEEAYVAPRDAHEALMARIWRDLLGVEKVGVEDNFFELGGDSILSIQVIARAAQAGLHLTPRQVFEHPTIAGLVAVAQRRAEPAAESGRIVGPLPLTPIQLWFFEQDLPHPEHFNQALLLETSRGLDPALLDRAVERLLTHHDALRIRFERAGGTGTWQQLHAEVLPGPCFALIDLAGLPQDFRVPALERAAGRLQASLDLSSGPLLRVTLFHLGPGTADRLMLVCHHLIVDGLSWRVLLADLESACLQLAQGAAAALPPKTTPFKRWAEHLVEHARSEAMAAEAAFWSELARQSFPRLATELDSGPDDVASSRTLTVSLAADETQALLQEVPRAYRTQINDVLLTALVEAMAGSTGARRLLLDLEGHGREDLSDGLDVSRTVGWFTSLFPVLLDLEGVAAPGAALKSIKEQLRAIPRRGIGYGLLRYLGPAAAARELRSMPPSEVVFNYLGQLDPVTAGGGLFRPAGEATGPVHHPTQRRRYLLEVSSGVSGGRLHLAWSYSANRFRDASIADLASRYMAALRSLIAHCLAPGTAGWTPSDFPLARVDQATLDRLAETAGSIADVYPASFLQQGMIFHSLLAPESGVYVQQVSLELGPELDAAAFEQAWRQLLHRHTILRTTFFWEDREEPLQVVLSQVELPWQRLDWSALSEDEQAARLAAYVQADRRRGFGFTSAPLMRCTLVHLGAEGYRFVWSHHHVLLDGWSLPLLLRDLFALYEAACGSEEAMLERPATFRDYVAWLVRQEPVAAESFWREELAGFAAPTPLSVERAVAAGTAVGEHLGSAAAALPADTGEAVRAFARRHQLTLNSLFQGAWAALLARYSAGDDVVFGAVTSGRSAPVPGIERMLGLFINTLPARVLVPAEARLLDWLRQLQERQAEARQYEHTALTQVQAWSAVPRGRPLFESILAFDNYPVDETVRREVSQHLRLGRADLWERTNYPLNVVVSPGTTLGLRIVYDSQRFDAAAIGRMLQHLASLLESMTADPDRPLAALSLLCEAERHQILREWQDAEKPCPQHPMIHERVSWHGRHRPGAVAVAGRQGRLTYGELEARANRLAHRLRSRGVGPDVLVALCTDRTLDRVVGIVAVLKAGGAYVSLDPTHPKERLAFLLEDARAPVLLTEERFAGALPESAAEVILVDAGRELLAGDVTTPPASGVTPDNIAYVVYTSGSTGRPKGVEIPHAGLMNLVRWHQDLYGVTPEDRGTQVASPAFDASIWELWPYLAAGAAVHIPDEEVRLSPSGMMRWWAEQGITLAYLMTPLAEGVLEEEIPPDLDLRVRALIIGGDRLHRGPDAAAGFRLMNHYGPAEYTVTSTVVQVPPRGEREGIPTIGRAIDNTRIYVLDRQFRLLPSGVPGELYVSGMGLARGYLRRPDLTAEKFLPDPFACAEGTPGARMYRTGDLVRLLPDGDVDFIGRLDHQVKIRGLRIELGEIEAALSQHPAVRETAVVVREDRPGDKRLVAYVVPAGDPSPAVEALREYLADRLPKYMVPGAVLFLGTLPLTPNGKVDRKALPAPEDRRSPGAAAVAGTPLEELLAGLFAPIFGMESIGIDDDFFALGGHSLSMVRAHARLRQAGFDLNLNVLFDRPSVRALASYLEGVEKSAGAVEEKGPSRCLVQLQSGAATQPPLFLVHALGGRVYFYRDLARSLGGSTVFGLRALGLEEGEGFHSSIEEMAACYLDAVRRCQPRGPYLLGGFSAGGAIAYEMAQQLRQQGEDVALLVLIDSLCPTETARRLDDGADLLAELFAEWLPVAAEEIRPLDAEAQLLYLLDVARQRGELPEDVDMAAVRRLRDLVLSLSRAVLGYRPRPYSGDILFFTAGERQPAEPARPELSWAGLAGAGFEVYVVPGMHSTMYRPPHVEIMAAKLRAGLASALSGGVVPVGGDSDPTGSC